MATKKKTAKKKTAKKTAPKAPVDHSELTGNQQAMLDAIRDLTNVRGFPPTIRELGDARGIKSPNGVMCHLKALVKKGYISHHPRLARSITLV